MTPKKPSEPATNGASSSGATRQNSALPTNWSALSWLELFTLHESNLQNHVDLCRKVNDHAVPDSEASRALKRLVDQTHDLMRQVEALRKEFASHGIADRVLPGKPVNKVDEQRAGSAATPQENDQGQNQAGSDANGQTASRSSKDHHPESKGSTATPTGKSDDDPACASEDKKPTPTPTKMPQRLKKRSREDGYSNGGGTGSRDGKKAKTVAKGTAGEPPNRVLQVPPQPPAQPEAEGEDITGEVERRLAQREERRQRRKDPSQKKRKRDSSASAVLPGHTPDSAKRRKVKAKDKDVQLVGVTHILSTKPSKQKKRSLGDMDSRISNGAQAAECDEGQKKKKRKEKRREKKSTTE